MFHLQNKNSFKKKLLYTLETYQLIGNYNNNKNKQKTPNQNKHQDPNQYPKPRFFVFWGKKYFFSKQPLDELFLAYFFESK